MAIDRFTKACVACCVELRCKTNGVLLVEASIHGFITLHEADLWHCPECDHEIIAGVAGQQLFGAWEGDILAEIKRREVRGQRVVVCWLNARERNEFMRRGQEAELLADKETLDKTWAEALAHRASISEAKGG